jgi:oligopeptide transport system permease protein
MVITLFLIITCTFFLMNEMPGSPFQNLDQLTELQYKLLDEKYGFDKPVTERYFTYLKNILHGEFGISLQFNNQSVAKIVFKRFGPSLKLGLQALVVGTLLGVLLGVIAAMKQNSWVDSFCSILAIAGRSVPNFIFAVLLQFVFAVSLKMLPITYDKGSLIGSILPTLALAISPMALSSRFIRTQMIEVLHSDYIELGRAKGANDWQLVFHHGLRNSLIPLITVLGPMIVSLVTGSLVVENIFAIPGVGEQLTKSILTHDYPTIMAITILFSALLIFALFVCDILYRVVDPRLRIEGGSS